MDNAETTLAAASGLTTGSGAAPVPASVELVPEASIIPLEERLRQVRRRRQLLSLRDWAGVIATFCFAATLVTVAVVAFMGR
jgi:hypothetical protein